MTIYAHIRRSKNKQDEASQREKIRQWVSQGNPPIDEYDCDAEGGGIQWQKRGLGALFSRALPGDTIVFSEVTRIARSTVGVLSFLEDAVEKGVHVVAIDIGIKLDGSLTAHVVACAFGMAGQIERYLLRSRTKAALDSRLSKCQHGADKGKPCQYCKAPDGLAIMQTNGRQPGALGKKNKLAGRYAEIKVLLDKKISKAGISRLLGVSRQTLDTFLHLQTGLALIEATAASSATDITKERES